MRKIRFHIICAALLAAVIMPFSVWAASESDVVIELTAKKIFKGEDGKEKLVPADKAAPGEVIEYTAVYKNKGKESVKNLQGTLPVPMGMEYMPGTARPSAVSASLDGKKFAPVPLKRKHRLPNGKEEVQEVPYNEYRYLGWALKDLAANQSVTVKARMRIVSETEPLKTEGIKEGR